MTSVEIALTFSLRNTRDIPSRSNSKRLASTAELKFEFTSAISEFGIILSRSCNIDNILTGIYLLPYAAPIRSSVRQRTEFAKRTIITDRRIFSPFPLPPFLLSPSHLPLGLLFLLSPIFHCHKIKDGGYNNTNTNKVSPTQNTPVLQVS